MKKKWVAYLFWLISGFGWFGLHNFYLNRPWRGVIWIFTKGLFWFGSAYDLLTIHKTVDEINSNYYPYIPVSSKSWLKGIFTMEDKDFITPPKTKSQDTQLSNITTEEKKVGAISDNEDFLHLDEIDIPKLDTGQNTYSKSELKNLFDLKIEGGRISLTTSNKSKEDNSKTTENKEEDVEYISQKPTPTFDFSRNSKPQNDKEKAASQAEAKYKSAWEQHCNERIDYYSAKTKLSEKDIDSIKDYRRGGTVFSRIEFCDVELLKLTLHLFNDLIALYKEKGIDYGVVLKDDSDKVYKSYLEGYKYSYTRFYGLWDVGPQFWYVGETIKGQILLDFKHIAEDTLRKKYRYSRSLEEYLLDNKLEAEHNYSKQRLEVALESFQYTMPDLDAEILLNKHSRPRWKTEIDNISIQEYDELLVRNAQNKSLQMVYHKCAKYCLKAKNHNKAIEYMLTAKKVALNNKSKQPTLLKGERKLLFRSEAEIEKYDSYHSSVNKDTDLKAIKDFANGFYHRKVILSKEEIQKAEEKNKAVSGVVNKYIEEDEDVIEVPVKSEPIEKESLSDILNASQTEVNFTESELSIINYLVDLDEVTSADLEALCKSKGIRLNKLFVSINKKTYELHEDPLLGLEDGLYTIDKELQNEIFN